MSVIICDFDEAYVGALTEYLLKKTGREMAAYTNVEDYLVALLMGEDSFEYGVLSREFYEAAVERISQGDSMEMKSIRIELAFKKLVILDTYIGCECEIENAQILYKFGSMEGLVSVLQGETGIGPPHCECNGADRVFAVYSPAHHELLEVFALSFSQMLAERSSVLFVDLMQNPIVFDFMKRSPRTSLTDFIYLRKNDQSVSMEDKLEYYGNIAIFPVAMSSYEMCEITADEWRLLIDYVKESGFENIVFCFDEINSGFEYATSFCDRLILVNRQGDFFERIHNKFFESAKGHIQTDKISDVNLPMSAHALSSGEYCLEELLVGNLGKYVRSINYGF